MLSLCSSFLFVFLFPFSPSSSPFLSPLSHTHTPTAKQTFKDRKQASLSRRDEYIQATRILLLSPSGKKSEVALLDAIKQARSDGITILQVSAEGQEPAVCKVVNGGKFMMEEREKVKKKRNHQHITHTSTKSPSSE